MPCKATRLIFFGMHPWLQITRFIPITKTSMAAKTVRMRWKQISCVLITDSENKIARRRLCPHSEWPRVSQPAPLIPLHGRKKKSQRKSNKINPMTHFGDCAQ